MTSRRSFLGRCIAGAGALLASCEPELAVAKPVKRKAPKRTALQMRNANGEPAGVLRVIDGVAHVEETGETRKIQLSFRPC